MSSEEAGMAVLDLWIDYHQAAVYRTACLILRDPEAAADVTQDAFLRAWRAADRLEPGAEVRPWLCRIAVNLALNRLRSKRREEKALAFAVHELPGDDDPWDGRLVRWSLADAVGRLPDRLRVPIVLRYYLDFSENEMARSLGVRNGTVKSRLHEARARLANDDAVVSAGQE